MKSNWLSARLTKSKQKSPMWLTLADVIQSSFEAVLGHIVSTISNNRSLMTMSVDEVKKRQESLGHFFNVLDVPDQQKGLTLSHRLDQIHLKATEFPIKDMVKRNFDGLEMDWSPVYAPVDQAAFPYGSKFISRDEYSNLDEAIKDDWFMTSRGRMVLYLNKYQPPEDEMARIYSTINETIVPMIPLTIVFDGFFTQVKITASFDIHAYKSFVNPINDKFESLSSIQAIANLAQSMTSTFTINDDSFSVDSFTRTERLPLDDRNYELLGEQPLGLIPLGAQYSGTQIMDSMAGASFDIGSQWKTNTGSVAPSGASFNVPPSIGSVYHLLSCEVGQRYIVRARKETNSNVNLIVSESNNSGGKIAELFKLEDSLGDYGLTFIATSISMYLVINLDSQENTVISDIKVNKLTAI